MRIYPGVVGVGVMKAGNHLLKLHLGARTWPIHWRDVKETMRLLNAQATHNSTALFGHIRYCPETAEFLDKWNITFLRRDPRDIIVSRYHYIDCKGDWELAKDKTLEQCNNLVQWEQLASQIVSYEELVTMGYPRKSATFRKGLVGEWKNELPDGLYKGFEAVEHWEVG